MRITQTALSALAVALVYMATPAIAQTAGAAPVAAAEVDQNAAIMAAHPPAAAEEALVGPDPGTTPGGSVTGEEAAQPPVETGKSA